MLLRVPGSYLLPSSTVILPLDIRVFSYTSFGMNDRNYNLPFQSIISEEPWHYVYVLPSMQSYIFFHHFISTFSYLPLPLCILCTSFVSPFEYSLRSCSFMHVLLTKLKLITFSQTPPYTHADFSFTSSGHSHLPFKQHPSIFHF